MSNQLLKVSDAQKMLGVSKKKIASLLSEGLLPYQLDVLDKRLKLVKVEDVERLAGRRYKEAA